MTIVYMYLIKSIDCNYSEINFHLKDHFFKINLFHILGEKRTRSDDDYMPDKDVDFEYDENKPHRCPHCNKSFGNKSNLYGHIRRFIKKITSLMCPYK